DTHNFRIGADTLYPREGVGRPLEIAAAGDAAGQVDLGKPSADVMTVGFYPPEGWGAWSKVDNPWVLLPLVLSGPTTLHVALRGFGDNVGRQIELHVGGATVSLPVTDDLVEHTVEIDVEQPVNFVRFSNVDHSREAGGDDTRTLGIGVEGIRVARTGAAAPERAGPHQLDLGGVVYTSIFNPRDGRKNWEDLLTAFCYAFRREARATLVLKMTCRSATEYLDDLFELLCQLHPFECRVVILHGYLEADEFAALLQNTSFVVNASRGEGQCLPLMEFMSSGIPAIAPANTAMADYITDGCAFIVDSTPEPTFWPHEKNQLQTTFWERPSWESLHDAYRASFRVATQEPERYVEMAGVAAQQLHQFCSIEVLSARLREFLDSLDDR
ncbi:MAG: glycosyltransferase, partial [Halioglobus sp.]|nr:glycosyltransferase [Halioglobus sp.]